MSELRGQSRLLVALLAALAVTTTLATRAGAAGRPVELHRLSETVWVHTTWKVYNGAQTPSNGLLVVAADGLVLVDTAWDDRQTKELLETAQARFGLPLRLAIITHAHQDRLGGVETLLSRGVPTYCTEKTARLAQKQGYQAPTERLDPQETAFSVGGVDMGVFFPGEGHTADNMTVWFPGERVLFAGCLVKAASSTSIGNVDDAKLEEWPGALDRLLEKYSNAETVIPGHGEWGGIELIEHTRDLLSRFGR